MEGMGFPPVHLSIEKLLVFCMRPIKAQDLVQQGMANA